MKYIFFFIYSNQFQKRTKYQKSNKTYRMDFHTKISFLQKEREKNVTKAKKQQQYFGILPAEKLIL